jgi:hypothetical protein
MKYIKEHIEFIKESELYDEYYFIMDETETYFYKSDNSFIPYEFDKFSIKDLLKHSYKTEREAQSRIDGDKKLAGSWLYFYNNNAGDVSDLMMIRDFEKPTLKTRNTKEGTKGKSQIKLAEEFNNSNPKIINFQLGLIKNTGMDI